MQTLVSLILDMMDEGTQHILERERQWFPTQQFGDQFKTLPPEHRWERLSN
jgi:hypothetical protein